MDEKKVFINDKIDLRYETLNGEEGMKFFDFLDSGSKAVYLSHPGETPKIMRFYKDECEDILVEDQAVIQQCLDLISESTFGKRENVWVSGAGWNYYFVYENGDRMEISFTHLLGDNNYYYLAFNRTNYRINGLEPLFAIDLEAHESTESDDNDSDRY